MTHYDISYKGMSLEDPSHRAKAIADIKDYLDERRWNIIMDAVKQGTNPRELDMCLHFVGIKGWPVFAFIREYCPDTYQAWYDALPD